MKITQNTTYRWTALALFPGLLFGLTLKASEVAATGAERELFETRYKSEIAPLFAKRCTECHGPEKKKGGVRWDEAPTLKGVLVDTEKWLALIEQVSTHQMPPDDKPQLTDGEAGMVAKWAESAIALADAARPKDPGYVLPRRLNRVEYNNTIHDLLGIDIKPADEFPVDDTGYGFDNIAAVLAMSPLLAEKYLDAAESTIDIAFGAPNPKAKNNVSNFKRKDFTLIEGVKFNNGTLEFASNATAKFSVECKPGLEYELQASAWQDKAGDEPAHGELYLDGKLLQKFNVPEVDRNPQKFKRRFKATAVKHELALAFTNDVYDAVKKLDRNLYFSGLKLELAAGIGPDEDFAKRVLIAKPGLDVTEENAAETILKRFATRAYRRPVSATELRKLLAVYQAARKGATFEAGLKRALTAVLVSPHFLLRTERRPADAPAAGAWKLNDYEIASRLSYFFWSSMPDDKLLELAAKQQLGDAAVRAGEIKRMLSDPKSKALVRNFAGQWLELRNLGEISFSNRRYPEWNNDLAAAMRTESEMLFEEIVKEDRSVLDFIDPGFTFLNERLAKHYGIKGVTGEAFQKVDTKDTKRGGILTMGSTLAVTSNPTRTSPVKRGKWLLEQILGSPPPPPPPEIPALADKSKDEAAAPLRERLEKHRADPSCAVCHIRMDGYGFTLENFDAIGRWRTLDGKFPVDAIGKIPGEAPLNGIDDLKKSILKRKPQFVRTFVEKLLIYALGRGTKPYDRATINEIVRRADEKGDKFSSVVLAIVESDAFLKRRDKGEKE